jgi:glycosyl-4,4'-diaponeurosporenoate acyltransferase
VNIRVLQLSDGWTVVLDVAVWAAGSSLTGYLMHRLGPDAFTRDGVITRLRPFERSGRFYEERLRIKRWKGRLPEAGGLFPGGFSKRSLRKVEPAYLERFVQETRRAEVTHWVIIGLGPLFFLWNPWWLGVVMVTYGIAGNAPCLLAQRYNRARLLRTLDRVRRRDNQGDPSS